MCVWLISRGFTWFDLTRVSVFLCVISPSCRPTGPGSLEAVAEIDLGCGVPITRGRFWVRCLTDRAGQKTAIFGHRVLINRNPLVILQF